MQCNAISFEVAIITTSISFHTVQALSLADDILQKREVAHLDIVNDEIDPRKYKADEVSQKQVTETIAQASKYNNIEITKCYVVTFVLAPCHPSLSLHVVVLRLGIHYSCGR